MVADTLKPRTQRNAICREIYPQCRRNRLFSKARPRSGNRASDDDPSGIGTYSKVGAQFGYGLLRTMVLSYPLMAAIQEISARIGRVTGVGIAANLRKNYPKPLLYAVLFVVSVANVFNLGADIGAIGAARQLVFAGSVRTRGIGTRHQGRRQGTTAIRSDTASPRLACSTCSSAAGSWLGTIEVKKGKGVFVLYPDVPAPAALGAIAFSFEQAPFREPSPGLPGNILRILRPSSPGVKGFRISDTS
jgi:hypothetical protein